MNCLLIGTGKRLGSSIRNILQHSGHEVYVISSRAGGENDLQVDWGTMSIAVLHRWLRDLPRLDLVLFNQNGASLSQMNFQQSPETMTLWSQSKTWQQTHWTSCILPYMIIHSCHDKIHETTKIFWMLSSVINDREPHLSHADYVANKLQNLMIMQNFSRHHDASFSGLVPGIADVDVEIKSKNFLQLVLEDRSRINGRVWDLGSGSLHEV